MDTSKIVTVNMPNFDEVLSQGIVLVDFWAEWCEPCKVQDPILMAVAAETPDEVIIAKLNVEDNKYITQQKAVRNIPSMILFNRGEEVQRWTGLQSKEVILSGINKYVNK
jgi:thioredoxin 1